MRGILLVMIYFFSVMALYETISEGQQGSTFLAIVAFVATPMLAVRVTRGTTDLGLAFALLGWCKNLGRDPWGPWLHWVGGAFGAALVAIGVFQHFRHRAIERRLLSLRPRS